MKNPAAAEAATKAIDALSVLFNNPDDISKRRPIANAGHEIAAFWTTATYSNQVASNFLDLANKFGVNEAVKTVCDRGLSWTEVLPILDTLIPLNPAARGALQLARRP